MEAAPREGGRTLAGEDGRKMGAGEDGRKMGAGEGGRKMGAGEDGRKMGAGEDGRKMGAGEDGREAMTGRGEDGRRVILRGMEVELTPAGLNDNGLFGIVRDDFPGTSYISSGAKVNFEFVQNNFSQQYNNE
jgi:hypothetical protein